MGLVRHPLYFSHCWQSNVPVMTEGAGVQCRRHLYFVIGSRLQKTGADGCGQTYVEYRRRVPWLIRCRHPGGGLIKLSVENPNHIG
jgi:hypothetical protein